MAEKVTKPRRYPCPRCNGQGTVIDDRDYGQVMRSERVRQRITLRELAKIGGVSASYLCDAELGRRRWNAKLVALYEEQLA